MSTAAKIRKSFSVHGGTLRLLRKREFGSVDENGNYRGKRKGED